MADAYSSASSHTPAETWARLLGGSSARAWLPVTAIALLAAFWGTAVAFADLNAVFLGVALVGCLIILFDFRIGVVLLIVLLPISRSAMFPHAMMGITGLNPLNLLLVGTFGSYVLHGLADGSLRRFLPRPLVWLYLVPLVVAGLLGSRHVDDIAPALFMTEAIYFYDAAGYLREMLIKPLMLVAFALLVGAAYARSRNPEKLIVPILISIWVMVALVVVYVARSGVGLAQLSSSTEREFFNPLGMHANDLGRLYVTAYALALFTWAGAKGYGLKLVCLASMVLTTAAVVLTFSRGAFLAFVVVNVLFLLWRMSAKTAVFAAVLALCALFALPGVVYDRAAVGFGQGLNAITAGRYEWLWVPLFPEIERSPIWGNGLGSIMWSDALRIAGADGQVILTTHPHNAYLEALLDFGIAGLVLILAYFIHVWRGFRRLGADPGLSPELRGFFQGAAAGLTAFLVAAITDGSLAPKAEQAFLWLAIGMMYGQLAAAKGRARDRR
jgi:O-antigen ligase